MSSRSVEITRLLPRGTQWGRPILIGIVLAYVGILLLWPILAMVRGAFANGVGQLVAVLNDPEVREAFWLTLLLAAAAVLLNGVFGTIVAWVLVRQRFTGRSFFNGIVDLPFVVSPVIAGYMLILLFGRRGWFAPVLEVADIKIIFAWPGMLLATIFVALPFMIREIMPVLQEIGTEPEQAAYTLGASGWQTFRRVTLPGIRWGLLYGLTLTLARALGEFGAVLVVGGAIVGRTETATLYIYRALDERMYTGAYTAAMVLGLISFIILITMER
ncbi:MAG TPA: molybdate ABC transporter permease subunit, partial [Ardenticatenaceae bacterium]|nr:molybdate ABC transporter permease subunit [Ardenticatenaceae bacterium]